MSEYSPTRFKKYVKMAARLSRHTDDYGRMGALDINAVLWALSGVESSFGKLAHQARFEKSYARGGRYYLQPLDSLYGDAAAMSYGPWQVMYCNAHRVTNGFVSPHELQGMTFAAQIATVMWLDDAVLDRGAKTMREIADAWNTGSHRDSILPAPTYLERVEKFYGEWKESD